MGFETFIAKRYLRSPWKERSISIITRISIGGVAIGVMVLIVVISVMNGFEKDLRGALQEANGHLTVHFYDSEGIKWNAEGLLQQKIKQTINPVALAPFTQHQAFIVGKNKPMGTLIKGIEIAMEPRVIPLYFSIRTESFESKRDNTGTTKTVNKSTREKIQKILSLLQPQNERSENKIGKYQPKKISGIILGSQLARNLGVDINDWVTVMSFETRKTPLGEIPRAKKFKVVGFYESGIMGFDEFVSIIDIKVAQTLFRMKDSVSGITIKLEDGEKAEILKGALQKKLGFPYYVSSWIEQNKNLFAMFRLEKIGLFIILSLIILIAAFNIISSLVMLVIEKGKDIAILKAMGASDRSIRKIFIIQGSVIGLAGTLMGEVLGLIVCWIISSFDIIDIPPGVYVGNRIPMHVEIWQLILVAVISMLMCFSVTVIPSRKASKLDPVDGLRNE